MEHFKRKAQAKWDRRHLFTVSTHLTTQQHDRLRHACACKGTIPYRLVRDFLLSYIRSVEAEEWQQAQRRIGAEEEWWRSLNGL